MDTVVIYGPDDRQRIGFWRTWALLARNVIRSRELIAQVFVRDFFAVYKKSFFGMAWLVVSPLVGVLSWLVMNAAGILRPGDVGIPYPAYVLLGSSIWGLFMGFYAAASGTLSAGSAFILQVQYPHEVLLIKQVAEHLANFLIGFLLNIAVLLIFGLVPSWKIVFFPVLALPLFLLGGGIGLVMAVVKVVAVDVQKAADLLLGLLIFATPVIYSADAAHPILERVIRWNPLTYLVCGARDVIVHGRMENPAAWAASAALSAAVFMAAWRFFFVAEDLVVEKMV